MVFLSDGGEDAITAREFDVTTRRFVPGGFVPADSAPGMSRRTLLLVALAGAAIPIIAAGAFVVVKSTQKPDRREEKPKDGLYRKDRNDAP